MQKSFYFLLICLWAALGMAGLSGCTPMHDWREVRGVNAPFVVLLPAKPASLSRDINLDGTRLTMTMTAAEVDGVTFAIGSAKLPDQMAPQAALNAMKTALVKNIRGKIRHEKTLPAGANTTASIEIEAIGAPGRQSGGQPTILFGRFAEKDRYIYQAVVTGPEKSVVRESVDTFFTSFKLN